MADLVRLAYYPFLPEVREAVRVAGPDLPSVLTSPLYQAVRDRAMERIEGALADGFQSANVWDQRSALLELLSVPLARMLAASFADKILINRYAASEARQAHDHLLRDPDPDAVDAALAALSIQAEPLEGGSWRMHISAYIRAAPHEPSWKLILRQVAAGHVELGKSDMARLVQEALQRRITTELEAERARPMPEEIKEALATMLKTLEPKVEEARLNWNTGDFGPVQPDLFPPCIKEIFESLKRGENVVHHGRFAFATFLHTVGWNSEQILDYLSSTPNFDREKSRYQIEHVTGEKSVGAYTPPGCATMQTNGICPLDKRDGLCFKIKHPLSYYRAQLRFRGKEAGAPTTPSSTENTETTEKPVMPR